MQKLKVQVTQDDINNGLRRDCRDCPISLATNRAVENAPDIGGGYTVSTTDSFIKLLNQYCAVILIANAPDSVYHFVVGFDHCAKVEPFEFEVEFNKPKY